MSRFPFSPKAIPQLSSHVRLQKDQITHKMALLHPEGVLLLNETAAAILELCDGTHCLEAICQELNARYLGRSPDEIAQDVQAYLWRLHQRHLLSWQEGSTLSKEKQP